MSTIEGVVIMVGMVCLTIVICCYMDQKSYEKMYKELYKETCKEKNNKNKDEESSPKFMPKR